MSKMQKLKLVTIASVFCIAGAQQGQVGLETFLLDPLYQSFTEIIVSDASVCMADRAFTDGKLNLSRCPEVSKLVKAVQSVSIARVDISCSEACVELLNTLGDSCRKSLISGFKNAKDSKISKYSTDFFNKCEGLKMEGLQDSSIQTNPSPENILSLTAPSPGPQIKPIQATETK